VSSYKLLITNGISETSLMLIEGIFGIEWECLDGEEVWGIPFKGRSFGPIMANGYIQLTDGDLIEGFIKPKKGVTGKGTHGYSNGGTFPEGEFEWEVE
jgi:hypothetical protein